MAAPAGQISLEDLSVEQLSQVKGQLEEVRVICREYERYH